AELPRLLARQVVRVPVDAPQLIGRPRGLSGLVFGEHQSDASLVRGRDHHVKVLIALHSDARRNDRFTGVDPEIALDLVGSRGEAEAAVVVDAPEGVGACNTSLDAGAQINRELTAHSV